MGTEGIWIERKTEVKNIFFQKIDSLSFMGSSQWKLSREDFFFLKFPDSFQQKLFSETNSFCPSTQS